MMTDINRNEPELKGDGGRTDGRREEGGKIKIRKEGSWSYQFEIVQFD